MRAIANPALVHGDGWAPPLFRDREDAGRQLAGRLAAYRGRDTLVLGIPRGGVPVAAAVARALDAELDVIVARKLGAPVSAELAIGAVTADGGRYVNPLMLRELGVDAQYLEDITRLQVAEAIRRQARFRGDAAGPEVTGRTVIVVDDGLATGATMMAAVRSLRPRHPARVVVAVPVASAEAVLRLQEEADEVTCVATPEPFFAVGVYYQDFSQTEDDEVQALLAEARRTRPVARDV